MSYIVVYQRPDGSSGLEECSSLDVAVVAAERLRNVDGVENPRILRTEEVHFDFRPYYRVEVATEALTSTPTPTPTVAPSTVLSSVREPVAASTEPDPVAPEFPAPVVGEQTESELGLDPWAAVDDAAHGDTSDSDEETTDSSDAADVDAADTTHDEVSDRDGESSVARGLFAGARIPEQPKNVADVEPSADDVIDAVPPRRGLFGR